jgi:predicted HicB family RNase H-like nuclease
MDILKYKGYEGTAELDMTRGVCRGKILLINDLVTYESSAISELQREFEAAVDDYIETCSALGREPQIALKGQFNVRVTPKLHRDLSIRAVHDGVSLNDVVNRACEAFVCQKEVNHNHNHKFTLTVDVDEMATLTRVASTATGVNWGEAKAHVQH